ncbi:unnamed protein product [Lupinus luteus]|uniref:Uncharacterized protein n=1 Tax=Lupinus luteus TaxID=3873 RepID=A0AAV1XRA2_LUPLU
MGQTSQAHETLVNDNLHETHQLECPISQGGALYGSGNPFVSCSNLIPSNYQLNWVFDNKFSSNGNQYLTSTTTSLPQGNNIIKDTTNQLVCVPSLYSSQNQSLQTTSNNMSATALLQKAAQIGATSSTESSFLGNFGLKCSNIEGQDGNKFCGMYGSSSLFTSLGSEQENSAGDLSEMPLTKRRHVQSEEGAARG